MKKVYFLSFIVAAFTLLGACSKAPGDAPVPHEDVILSSGTIGVGGSLSDALGRAGISSADAAQAQLALKPYADPRRMKPKDRYEILKTTYSALVQLTYWPNDFEYYTVRISSTGIWRAASQKVQTEEAVMGVSGKIQVSLWEAMSAQGLSPEMIYRFADIFGWRIDFLTEPRAGDTYKVIWKRSSAANAMKEGDILYALYQGNETGIVYAFRFSDEYFDDKGDSLRGEFLRAPLAYRRISSRYTNARFHPILRYWRPHHGIDYSAARGTPVVSIGDGSVISKGYHGGLGNEIRVRHAGSYVSIYGHLMGFARGLRPGSSVKQGQVVGYVGSTGLSTGPHLHFGLERSGQLINFLSLKSSLKRRSITASERDRYRDAKKEGFSYFGKLDSGSTTVQVIH